MAKRDVHRVRIILEQINIVHLKCKRHIQLINLLVLSLFYYIIHLDSVKEYFLIYLHIYSIIMTLWHETDNYK